MWRRSDSRSPAFLKKRVLSISEKAVPFWGEMSIEECLLHLCETFEIAFGKRELKVSDSAFLRHPLTKWLVIEGPFSWLNGMRTSSKFVPCKPEDLEGEKMRAR